MTEAQFTILEDFWQSELKEHGTSESFEEDTDLVSTKDLVLNLRERLNITREIHNLLFNDEL